MKACAQFEELLAAGAAGGLDAPDRQVLEAHLAACPGCTAEAALLADAVALLPLALPPLVPSDIARARLRARLRPVARRRPGMWVLAAAATLAAAAFAGLWLRDRGELERVRGELTQREAFYQSELSRVEKKYAILRSPNLRTVDLKGESQGTSLDARAFVDKEQRTWVVLSYRLPKLPADKDYELWFFNGQKPVRAGILSQDPDEPTRIEVPPDLPQITATAVTIEPKGGVAQPTGPVVMKGAL